MGRTPHLRPEPHKILFHAHGITRVHTHAPRLLLGQSEFVPVPDPTGPPLTEVEQGGCLGGRQLDGQKRGRQCWGPIGGHRGTLTEVGVWRNEREGAQRGAHERPLWGDWHPVSVVGVAATVRTLGQGLWQRGNQATSRL